MTNIKVKEHKTVSTAHNEDYRILIRSVSEQFEHTEPLPAEETDKIELMTYGSFLKKAGSYYISYKETETIGFAGCTTTIKIAEDGSRVALLRFGKVNTQLVIQRDYRNICYYETEVGPITLGVRPEHLLLSGSEDNAIRGTVDVSEMMGSAVHLHVSACGRDTIMIVPTTEIESSAAFTIGSPIAFTFSGSTAHLFDRETQKNLEI